MAGKAVILQGDKTSHGGVVLQGSSVMQYCGTNVALVGHLVSCPLCKGVFPIVMGASTVQVVGVQVAVEGMKTACGASLIASQHECNA
ncbi:PAAR domain-containing protein [Serratia sp. JSRIV001]|uniref:PAAR domain-containing protein n=1 Tax=Serratia sp. JSRIV001 TaxID=2831893 RepID=UPI001CBD1AF3|nr:PAAR domain-containing protein [Serratia sp. JSRIV001]UAN46520.1 PAAR domain-containing protein [Serratia sp. JSRIV001]